METFCEYQSRNERNGRLIIAPTAECAGIVYALEHEICELRKKCESADMNYKKETGEWSITHEERDKFLYEQTTEILDKIKAELKEH